MKTKKQFGIPFVVAGTAGFLFGIYFDTLWLAGLRWLAMAIGGYLCYKRI